MEEKQKHYILVSTRFSQFSASSMQFSYERLSLLKWYYDQKISFFFSSDFERVFAYHLTGKSLSFEFYPKAVYFECKFWILRSAITHVQN